jgi:hypothetical protein
MKPKFLVIVASIAIFLSFSSTTQATSYLPGYEPYTYVYVLTLDASQDPAVQYAGNIEGYLSSAQWQQMLYGPPNFVYHNDSSFSANTSELYLFEDFIIVIYYNPDGYSTQGLLIPSAIFFGAPIQF